MEARGRIRRQATLAMAATPVRSTLLHRKRALGSTVHNNEYEVCRKEQPALQRRPIDHATASLHTHHPSPVAAAPPMADDLLRSPDQPVDTVTHAFTESRFWRDFSGVPVHAPAAEGFRSDCSLEVAHRGMQIAKPRLETQPPEEAMVRQASMRLAEFVPAWSTFEQPKGEKTEAAPKEEEPAKRKEGATCHETLRLFKGEKGAVNFYLAGGANVLQAGKTEVKDPKDATAGVNYTAVAELDPYDCGEPHFVQNIQSTRVVTFKDASRLEKITPWCLDTEDPYPSDPVDDLREELRKRKWKPIATNDSPAQGTGGADQFIDTLSTKDTFKLFLMLGSYRKGATKGKTERHTLGLANWNWLGQVTTGNKRNINSKLKLEPSTISAPDGVPSTEAPLLSPNIQDQKFQIVGKGRTLASLYEDVFNGGK